jgi:hypothetical protein
MKTIIFLAASSLLLSACTTPPPVSGSISNKMGTLKLLPDGRVEIVIEPRTGK